MKTARLDRFPNGFTVETWYDRSSRNWITQTKDAEHNQIGDATYSGNQLSARFAHRTHTAPFKQNER